MEPMARPELLEESPTLCRLLGHSPAIRHLKYCLQRVAGSEVNVLILGESGTGKDLVAQVLHELSPRRAGPYIAVNCGAIAPNIIESELLGHERGSFTGAERCRAGYFEAAHRGSLFLDEISEMPMATQVKLLRVLETRTLRRVGGSDEIAVDLRIVAASNRPPSAAIRDGLLREDLLYRLSVVRVTVPPLRERPDDIPVLANQFLQDLNRQENQEKRFSPGFLRMLSAYAWPGNVRELKNAVNRAYILCDDLIELPADALFRAVRLPRLSSGSLKVSIGTSLEECERELILATLKHCRDDRPRCAAMLGVSLRTLYNRLDRYGYSTIRYLPS